MRESSTFHQYHTVDRGRPARAGHLWMSAQGRRVPVALSAAATLALSTGALGVAPD
jgi:hypothetical protein